MASTATSEPISRRGRRLNPAPAIAGITYLAVWVVGLAIWPSNLDVGSSDSQVIAAYAGPPRPGNDPVPARPWRGRGRPGRSGPDIGLELHATAAQIAGATSRLWPVSARPLCRWVQCGLLAWVLAGWAVPGGDAPLSSGLLFAAINRLDGVKMLALAAMDGVLQRCWYAERGCCLVGLGYPRRHSWRLALVISGIGYLLLINTLAPGRVRIGDVAAVGLGRGSRHLALLANPARLRPALDIGRNTQRQARIRSAATALRCRTRFVLCRKGSPEVDRERRAPRSSSCRDSRWRT